MAVLVIGASGQIGRFLLPRLATRGERVIAFSRQEQAPIEGVQWVRAQVPDSPLPEGRITAIISMGPLVGFDEWLSRIDLHQRPRVIATSSMSAQSKLDSELRSERELAQSMRDSEARMARLCDRHGCPWIVLRPTMIYGIGMDKTLSPIARRAMQTGVFPLLQGEGLRQPVHADDIAQAIVAALDRREASGYILPIGGGERLSVRDMFVRVRRSLPRWTLPMPVPLRALRMLRYFMQNVRGTLSRFQTDLVADNTELERRLGVRPRPFRPDPSCWEPSGRVR
ncbi:NAD-dependent epimerase/dehydratase family protein [Dyella sp.]|uniref:NAD-dependent epimerase/dehydratase family protein n=1 Tax=Dyella sp. TaxID=1869338 RepID=UPI002ED42203